MELKIYTPADSTVVQAIEWNNEELKKELTEKVKMYNTLVYTDSQIAEAKKDKATLNKLRKAIEDKRKDIKKQCLEPYNNFELQVKEVLAILDEPINLIDTQVKDFDEKRKDEKKAEIEAYFMNKEDIEPFVTLDKIFNDKWLNASVSMKSIKDDIDSISTDISNNVLMLSNLPEFGFEAMEVYKSTLDLQKSIMEAKTMAEIQKAKEEEAKQKAYIEEQKKAIDSGSINKPQEEPQEEPKKEKEDGKWLSFSALLNVEQAKKLAQFFNENNIEFKQI